MLKKKPLAETFLQVLVARGHSGDKKSLKGINEALNQGLQVAIKHYGKYLPEAEVKKLTARQINTLVTKHNAVIWTEEGIIFRSKKLKVPELNGRLLLIENIEPLAKKEVIICWKD